MFAREVRMRFSDQLMAPYLSLAHVFGEFMSLGSCSDRYVTLELHALLEARIKLMHDGPGVDSTDPRCSHVEGDSFAF